MIHNGIEYALMQSYGEGFEAMASYPHAAPELRADRRPLESRLSYPLVAFRTRSGRPLKKTSGLNDVRAYVDDSGMGRWTVKYGVEHAVPMSAISAALFARFASRQDDSFSAKLAAALRNEFGGHQDSRAGGPRRPALKRPRRRLR